MTKSDPSCVACDEIRNSLEKLRSDIPNLKAIADSFEKLFLQIAIVKEKIPPVQPENSELDALRFAQGVPILKTWKVDLPGDLFSQSSEAILPVMQQCFPKIAETLKRISEYIHSHKQPSYELLSEDRAGSSSLVSAISEDLDLDNDLVRFIVTQIIKPFAEKISDSMTPLPSHLNWSKGYCPICGSWPEVSFIRGTEGKRSLRCSFCGHEWSFARLMCPFCENDDQSKLELYFSEDRKFERAELCHNCKKYVVSIDTRNMVQQPAAQVAALGMIYLDFLAQEKGFAPGAVCAWNVMETPKR